MTRGDIVTVIAWIVATAGLGFLAGRISYTGGSPAKAAITAKECTDMCYTAACYGSLEEQWNSGDSSHWSDCNCRWSGYYEKASK